MLKAAPRAATETRGRFMSVVHTMSRHVRQERMADFYHELEPALSQSTARFIEIDVYLRVAEANESGFSMAGEKGLSRHTRETDFFNRYMARSFPVGSGKRDMSANT